MKRYNQKMLKNLQKNKELCEFNAAYCLNKFKDRNKLYTRSLAAMFSMHESNMNDKLKGKQPLSKADLFRLQVLLSLESSIGNRDEFLEFVKDTFKN